MTTSDDLGPPIRKHRPKRLRAKPYELTIEMILGWVDRFHDRHGRWPKNSDGKVDGTLQENWSIVDDCLRDGRRGLPGGSSLVRLAFFLDLPEGLDCNNKSA